MSFDDEFTPRWKNVLEPAINDVLHYGSSLKAFRVDLSKIGDAILTEILHGISESAVIVADISTIGFMARAPREPLVVRSANVLYEVGIAHASRRPEEVVLFRSDKDKLDFDVQGVRVHEYDPDGNPEAARTLVGETVAESLRSVDAARSVAISHAAGRLTPAAVSILQQAIQSGGTVQDPPKRNVIEVVGSLHIERAIELLKELGALAAQPNRYTMEAVEAAEKNPSAHSRRWLDYKLTRFGSLLFNHYVNEVTPTDPDVLAKMNEIGDRQARAIHDKDKTRGPVR